MNQQMLLKSLNKQISMALAAPKVEQRPAPLSENVCVTEIAQSVVNKLGEEVDSRAIICMSKALERAIQEPEISIVRISNEMTRALQNAGLRKSNLNEILASRALKDILEQVARATLERATEEALAGFNTKKTRRARKMSMHPRLVDIAIEDLSKANQSATAETPILELIQKNIHNATQAPYNLPAFLVKDIFTHKRLRRALAQMVIERIRQKGNRILPNGKECGQNKQALTTEERRQRRAIRRGTNNRVSDCFQNIKAKKQRRRVRKEGKTQQQKDAQATRRAERAINLELQQRNTDSITQSLRGKVAGILTVDLLTKPAELSAAIAKAEAHPINLEKAYHEAESPAAKRKILDIAQRVRKGAEDLEIFFV